MACLAVLYPFNTAEVDVRINSEKFLIGRAKTASYDIKDVAISRNQCVLLFHAGWTICDKSSVGTWVNDNRLEHNVETVLKDGDKIKLGETYKYIYIFCLKGSNCPNFCKRRANSQNAGLDAEMDQRRRLFEFNASLQRDGIEKSIQAKHQDRIRLEYEQKLLRDNFNKQLLRLEERNQQLHQDLEKKGNVSGSRLLEERVELERQFQLQKQSLEEIHLVQTSDLSCKISAFEAAEIELRNQNKALSKRLEEEKLQFEMRLAEERKSLEAKFAEQLAEQQRLAAEKSEVEEALRLRIQDLEKVAHIEEEQQQQRLVEREKESERLSKEKLEFEKRLEELQKALEDKERQEKQREQELRERDLELRAQEEKREKERKEREKELEAEFLARKKELENLEKLRLEELDKHRKEVAKELLDREAELKRIAEEHEKEMEVQRVKEHEKLKKTLEEKEQKMRQELEWEIMKLSEDKVAIEMNIRGELDKKEGENAEILAKLRLELEQVKKDLNSTSSKRTLLEKQLEEASRAKEAASKSELQARKDVIENFGELVESELQCSICNELFVSATTLNCNHTFCQLCIGNWLEKQKTCPICRAPLSQQSRSLVLDNFIDKVVENLSEDLKKRRKEIVEERRVLAHVAGLVANPNKKRKSSVGNIATPPLQVVNGNRIVQGTTTRVLVPVNSLPAGARVIQLDSGFQLLTAQSTSQMTVPAGQPVTVATSQPLRPPPLRPQLQQSVPPSSLAPVQMMRVQIAPRPLQVAGIGPGGRAVVPRPNYALGSLPASSLGLARGAPQAYGTGHPAAFHQPPRSPRVLAPPRQGAVEMSEHQLRR